MTIIFFTDFLIYLIINLPKKLSFLKTVLTCKIIGILKKNLNMKIVGTAVISLTCIISISSFFFYFAYIKKCRKQIKKFSQ